MKFSAMRPVLFDLACQHGVILANAAIGMAGDIGAIMLGDKSLYQRFGEKVIGDSSFSYQRLGDTIGETQENDLYYALTMCAQLQTGGGHRRSRWMRKIILRDLGLTEVKAPGIMA